MSQNPNTVKLPAWKRQHILVCFFENFIRLCWSRYKDGGAFRAKTQEYLTTLDLRSDDLEIKITFTTEASLTITTYARVRDEDLTLDISVGVPEMTHLDSQDLDALLEDLQALQAIQVELPKSL